MLLVLKAAPLHLETIKRMRQAMRPPDLAEVTEAPRPIMMR